MYGFHILRKSLRLGGNLGSCESSLETEDRGNTCEDTRKHLQGKHCRHKAI